MGGFLLNHSLPVLILHDFAKKITSSINVLFPYQMLLLIVIEFVLLLFILIDM